MDAKGIENIVMDAACKYRTSGLNPEDKKKNDVVNLVAAIVGNVLKEYHRKSTEHRESVLENFE